MIVYFRVEQLCLRSGGAVLWKNLRVFFSAASLSGGKKGSGSDRCRSLLAGERSVSLVERWVRCLSGLGAAVMRLARDLLTLTGRAPACTVGRTAKNMEEATLGVNT